MNRNCKLWETIFQYQQIDQSLKKTQHISVFAIPFTGYTQSEKIVNQSNKIIGINNIKMPNQCSQIWLMSPTPESGNPYA